MNIEILQENINTFNKEVVESGFNRDLDDFISSIPTAQNNIVAMRDIAEKVLSALDNLYASDLPDGLEILLPKKKTIPFTEVPHNDNLRKLLENTETKQPELFNQLNQFLSQLRNQLNQNITDITRIEEFIIPYISEEVKRIEEDNFAIIAIVFKDSHTITNLKQFTKSLKAWDKILPIYHQLLKSESPEDIKIVEIQNGSIDFVVSLDVDIAFNIAELFKVGFEVFAGYLAYKKLFKPIIDTYHGNDKLINLEKEKETLMLENIGVAIDKQVAAQHKEAKKADKNVDDTSIKKKLDMVTKLITNHIVKGNDLKLLALPEIDEDEEKSKKYSDEKNALLKQSKTARKELRNIPVEDRKMLLEMYGNDKEEK